MTDELHLKYTPVMRFSRGECFFPMSVADFLNYSALYVKDQETPIIAKGQLSLDDLTGKYNTPQAFFRSVNADVMRGIELAGSWGESAVRLIAKWACSPVYAWSEEMAHSAYQWLTEKNKAATRLFWWNSLLLPKAYQDRQNGPGAELPRFKLPPDMRQSAIENYQTSQGGRPNYTYYYRLVPQGAYLDLQYWFFYSYNDWAGGYNGFNDHEGDWEGFHVFFKCAGGRPVEPPAFVCYLGHHSRLTKAWDHPEVEKIGTHPVIYVGAGSHAGYPEPKQYPLMALYNLIDYATGESFTLDHSQWQNRVDLASIPWLTGYLGSWGTRYWLSLKWLLKTLAPTSDSQEINLPGVSAPRGPQFDDACAERASWGRPLEFAGIK